MTGVGGAQAYTAEWIQEDPGCGLDAFDKGLSLFPVFLQRQVAQHLLIVLCFQHNERLLHL